MVSQIYSPVNKQIDPVYDRPSMGINESQPSDPTRCTASQDQDFIVSGNDTGVPIDSIHDYNDLSINYGQDTFKGVTTELENDDLNAVTTSHYQSSVESSRRKSTRRNEIKIEDESRTLNNKKASSNYPPTFIESVEELAAEHHN